MIRIKEEPAPVTKCAAAPARNVTRVTKVIGPKATGRPRVHRSAAERQKAYRERKKEIVG
jgi:hypothetical protein